MMMRQRAREGEDCIYMYEGVGFRYRTDSYLCIPAESDSNYPGAAHMESDQFVEQPIQIWIDKN